MKAQRLPRICRKLILLVSTALLLTLSLNDLQAQAERPARGNRNRGNRMDPAQFQERRVARLKEQLEVTKDDEWSIILPRVEKVMQTQRELRMGGMGGMGRGGPGGGGANNPDEGANSGRNRASAGTNPEETTNNPDAAALRKAVEAKASAAELKTHIAKMRETLKKREAALAAAQDELRKVLTTRQEAIAILLGLLH